MKAEWAIRDVMANVTDIKQEARGKEIETEQVQELDGALITFNRKWRLWKCN